MRWPGKIPAGTVKNGIAAHLDWFLTTLAATGDTTTAKQVKKGVQVGKKKARVHLDGYNLLPYLTGKEKKSPRKEFIYLNDRGIPVGIRVKD